MPKNISFSEKAKGWTSFHSFIPDAMTRLNNRFFSIKDGQLWLHNDKDNPNVNNFYGEQFTSEVKTIFNKHEDIDKIFKTLVLEGNYSWAVDYKTNYTEGHIKANEFNKKESRWFAYMRKNEVMDYTGHSAQGIGNIIGANAIAVTFQNIPDTVSVGDELHQFTGGTATIPIGVIQNIDRNSNLIFIENIINAPIIGTLAVAVKNSRVEGSEIRGYYLEVNLTYSGRLKAELFAINTNAKQSHF